MIKINNKEEAKNAFIVEYGSLARALNPAAIAYDGYNFVKATIKINAGQEVIAYIAHNSDEKITFVVPVDGSLPTIEDFDNIEVIRKVKTAKQAVDAFLEEYASLARALNPAAIEYDGYSFVKEKITIKGGETIKAWIAFDTAKKTAFVVPVNGEKPDILDYKDIVVL